MSGLCAALELLKLGVHTTIYEGRPDPKTGIVCAGGISLWTLKRCGLTLPKNTISSQINRVRIHAPNGHFWQGDSGGRTLAYTLRRDRLEEGLSNRVRKLGGTIKYGNEVKTQKLRRISGAYDFIVGADGISGATRRVLNLPMPRPEDVHIGVQQLCSMPARPSNQVDLYFGKSIAPSGYAWVFPTGKGVARVGLGVPLSEKTNSVGLLNSFTKRINATPLEELNAKLIPTSRPLRNPAFGNTLLVGDAGGFCDPLTGGGIAGAVISAKAAAKAISEGNPKMYKKYVGWLNSQNKIRYRIKRALIELSDEELCEMVWAMEGFQVHPYLMSLNIVRAMLTLALHHPRLIMRHRVIRKLLGLSKS